MGPCAYLMHDKALTLMLPALAYDGAETFDNHLIQHYLIIKVTEFLGNITPPLKGHPP